MRLRNGQAMVETVVAVVLLTVVFFTLYDFSRRVAARTVLDYAAARAARAKAVGFNEFMCEKSARAAMIPVAGRRTWPADLNGADVVSRIPIYLSSANGAVANGVLAYEYWPTTTIDVDSGGGIAATAEAKLEMRTDSFTAHGAAKVESHYPFYMWEQGR